MCYVNINYIIVSFSTYIVIVLAGKSSRKFFDQTNKPVHWHQAIGGHYWSDFHLSSGKLPGMTN